MKELLWNLGIAIIRIGYKIRYYQFKPDKYSLRWNIGVFVLKYGYKLRGEIPQRTWNKNHI